MRHIVFNEQGSVQGILYGNVSAPNSLPYSGTMTDDELVRKVKLVDGEIRVYENGDMMSAPGVIDTSRALAPIKRYLSRMLAPFKADMDGISVDVSERTLYSLGIYRETTTQWRLGDNSFLDLTDPTARAAFFDKLTAFVSARLQERKMAYWAAVDSLNTLSMDELVLRARDPKKYYEHLIT